MSSGNRQIRPLLAVMAALAMGATGAIAFPSTARAGGAVTKATITDPALQMTAYHVGIPAGWKFQGTVFPGPPCHEIPFPTYRAYSPDGLTEMRMLPRFDWTYNTLNSASSNQCLPLTRKLTATQFLSYYIRLIGVKYVGDMTVAPIVKQRVAALIGQMNQTAATTPGYHAAGDIAAIRVLGKNGSFDIEQRLRALVICHDAPFMHGSTITGCFARVDVLRAPKGRLDALADTVDGEDLNTAGSDPAWVEREGEVLTAIAKERLGELVRYDNAVLQAQQERFEQSMAIQKHNHEQFLAQMQASTDASMSAANASMVARSTAASDWVDYSLDRQTVTGSGGTVKVSSAYSETWSNGQGQWYQTNDPDADPNGALGGNWTRQTVVHGNGSPK